MTPDPLATVRAEVERLRDGLIAEYVGGGLYEDDDRGRLEAYAEVLDLIDKQREAQ